jgi:hypothetical protein
VAGDAHLGPAPCARAPKARHTAGPDAPGEAATRVERSAGHSSRVLPRATFYSRAAVVSAWSATRRRIRRRSAGRQGRRRTPHPAAMRAGRAHDAAARAEEMHRAPVGEGSAAGDPDSAPTVTARSAAAAR